MRANAPAELRAIVSNIRSVLTPPSIPRMVSQIPGASAADAVRYRVYSAESASFWEESIHSRPPVRPALARLKAPDTIAAVTIVGNVKGKTVMMFDDMITTAGTVTEAAKLVRQHGAAAIYVAATHAVFAGQALDRLVEAQLNEIVVTDTIPAGAEAVKRLPNLTVLSVASLVGEAIRRIHEHRSVSALFR